MQIPTDHASFSTTCHAGLHVYFASTNFSLGLQSCMCQVALNLVYSTTYYFLLHNALAINYVSHFVPAKVKLIV